MLKFGVTTAELFAAVKVCQTLCSKKPINYQSYRNQIKVSVTSTGTVCLTAFGNSTGAYSCVTFTANLAEHGVVAVDSKQLADFLKTCPKGSVTAVVQVSIEQVVVTCGQITARLNTMPLEDLPATTGVEVEGTKLEIQPDIFAQLIDSVLDSMSSDKTRCAINSIYVEALGGYFSVTATDGHRLSNNSICLDKDSETKAVSAIIPAEDASALYKALKLVKPSGVVNLTIGSNAVVVVFNSYSQRIELLDRSYPDYSRIILENTRPTTFVVKVPRDSLLGLLQQAKKCVYDSSHSIRLGLSDDNLRITSGNSQNFDGSLAVKYTKDDFATAFNVNYLLGAVKSFPVASILKLNFNATEDPLMLDSDDGTALRVVVMPTRL